MAGNLSRFGEYLRAHSLDRETVAEVGDVTPSYVSMLAHGKASPGLKLARKIQRWTQANKPQAFTCMDWEE